MRTRTLITTVAPGPLLSDTELTRLRSQMLTRRDRQRRRTTTPFPGTRHSPFIGQGLELHELRPYQPGDERRHLDWRATARRGRPYARVFIAERQPALLLIVDRRPAMAFGTRREIKMTAAARCAALLAFATLADGGRVGGIVLEHGLQQFAPGRSTQALTPLLQAVTAPPTSSPQASPSLAQAIDLALRQRSHGTALCVISDLADIGSVSDAQLQRCGQQLSTVFIRVRDPAELTLPDAGWLRLRSPEGDAMLVVDSSDPVIRQRHAAAVLQHDQQLARRCRRANITLLTLDNDRDALMQLDHVL
ncbi:MAG: DUF58 domain-containing protein [Gammaproteobacteria bacterium]|nr:DUF58 domain-containing protein [Gammaproteobacteria bacterium]